MDNTPVNQIEWFVADSIPATKAFVYDKNSIVILKPIKFPCCDTMDFMVKKCLIQWKQKYGHDIEGFYFCSNEHNNSSYEAHTNVRKGKAFIYCPYCRAELPKEKPRIYRLKGI